VHSEIYRDGLRGNMLAYCLYIVGSLCFLAGSILSLLQILGSK
jgi:hypothetical protein